MKLMVALLAGIIVAFFTMPIAGSLYAWLFPESLAFGGFLSLIVTASTFAISGYVAALIAKGNEMTACVLLGAVFLTMTVASYYWPGNSDTMVALLKSGLTKFVSCTFGGFLRILSLKRHRQKRAV